MWSIQLMGYIAKFKFDIIYTVQLKRLVDIIDNDDNSELLKKVFVVQYSFDLICPNEWASKNAV